MMETILLILVVFLLLFFNCDKAIFYYIIFLRMKTGIHIEDLHILKFCFIFLLILIHFESKLLE